MDGRGWGSSRVVSTPYMLKRGPPLAINFTLENLGPGDSSVASQALFPKKMRWVREVQGGEWLLDLQRDRVGVQHQLSCSTSVPNCRWVWLFRSEIFKSPGVFFRWRRSEDVLLTSLGRLGCSVALASSNYKSTDR